MSLGIDLRIDYFIEQKHITDLEKLKDEELCFIIRLFRDELENFIKSEEFKLKGLIIACNKMKDLIKDFRFILNGYLEAINYIIRSLEEEEEEEDEDTEEVLKKMDKYNGITFCFIEEIKQLLTEMDKIENILDKIKTVRLLKERVDELANKCIYKMRSFYGLLSNFINGEIYFWENSNLKKRILYLKNVRIKQ